MLTPDQMTAIVDRSAQEKFGQLLQEIEAQTALLGADNELLHIVEFRTMLETIYRRAFAEGVLHVLLRALS